MMLKIPFHKECKPCVEDLVKNLDVTSAWVCKFDVADEAMQVVGFGVGDAANPMEKVSDLFEKYSLAKTPRLKEWFLNQPEDMLIFQIRALPLNDPDRREYIINGVNTVLFAPVYIEDTVWGVLEIWETRRPRKYSEEDLTYIAEAVANLVELIES